MEETEVKKAAASGEPAKKKRTRKPRVKKQPGESAAKKPAKEPGEKAAKEPGEKAAKRKAAKPASKEPGKKVAKKSAKDARKKPAKTARKKHSKIPPKKKRSQRPISKSYRKSVKAGKVRFGKKVSPNAFYVKPVGGEKGGTATRLVPVKKPPAYYAAELKQKKRAKRVKVHRKPLRSSLTPGTVCIVLAGIHKGKKVVFLKQLAGGLCLITGPFRINSCPLRRVNSIYLIATSLKIDISGYGIPKHIKDGYFRRMKPTRPRKEEGDIFEQKKVTYVPTAQRKRDQKVVDGIIMSSIRKRPDKKMVFCYLGTMFGLKKTMYPHRLKF